MCPDLAASGLSIFEPGDHVLPEVQMARGLLLKHRVIGVLCAAVLIGSVTFASSLVSACNEHRNYDYKGAPGPLAAAGLPFLAIGYGAYDVRSHLLP
jgi:hypothetical protein